MSHAAAVGTLQLLVPASASVTLHLKYVCVYIKGSYPLAVSGAGGGAGERVTLCTALAAALLPAQPDKLRQSCVRHVDQEATGFGLRCDAPVG